MKAWLGNALGGNSGQSAHQPFDLALDEGDGVGAACRMPAPANPATLEQLEKSLGSMPRPSWVWHEMQAAFADHASLHDIGHIIAQDTALAAEIIRVANAPAFGLLKPIIDVDRAVAHLGSNMVRSISTRQCLSAALYNGPAFFDQQMLWRHSMAVSSLAEIIARHTPRCNAAEAATLGLLHDLGRMLLNHVLRASQAQPATALLKPRGFLHWEDTMAGCTHIEAGIMLALAWELPDQLIQGIRHHHDPAFAEPESVPKAVRNEVFAVYLADLLAIHLKFPGGNPCKTLPLPAWAPMLPRTTLHELAASEAVSKALWKVYATDL
ncbi:MAG: HDOD domain-containing protein [Mariprofundaceae bacterium]|nr:HDOD domain-containing protein [Mariprofundaceae bacterium]